MQRLGSSNLLSQSHRENPLKHLLSIIVSIACLLVSLHAQAQVEGVEYDWKLRLNKAGIQVFTSKVPG